MNGLTDVLANFPDMSVVLIEEIMDKLVKEGVLSKTGEQSYNINKHKKLDYEFDAVKEETDGQIFPSGKQNVGEDHMYMKALYYALPMDYITTAKLQSKFEGEANMTIVCELIDKMIVDGFVDVKSNRRLGRRVIHSDLSDRKLMEVKQALDMDAVDVDLNDTVNESNHLEMETTENIETCPPAVSCTLSDQISHALEANLMDI